MAARGEAIGIHVIGIEHDLQRVGRLGLLLEVSQGAAELLIGLLGLDQDPRFAIADDEEVDFAFLLVPQVAEPEFSQSQVRPTLDGLEQVAGDERLRPLALIGDAGPIAQEPLGLFA